MSELKVGLKGSAQVEVVHENTAAAVGSGALEVFATPSMIALMEKAALASVQPLPGRRPGHRGREAGFVPSGSYPVGMSVRAESELTEIDRRMLTFRVSAYAGDELIGEGTHQRCVVFNQRFMEKAPGKRK